MTHTFHFLSLIPTYPFCAFIYPRLLRQLHVVQLIPTYPKRKMPIHEPVELLLLDPLAHQGVGLVIDAVVEVLRGQSTEVRAEESSAASSSWPPPEKLSTLRCNPLWVQTDGYNRPPD